MSKVFTLDEAQTLLPVLGALLRRARELAIEAGGIEAEMQELAQRIFLAGGLHVDVASVARRRAEREKLLASARSTIEEIEAIGAKVGEVEDGVLEFPCSIEGRTVLLLWTLGEADEITSWREEEDESSVRREIDGRFTRKQRDRLN